MTSSDESRVILAITETAPIDTLWQVVSRWLSSPATKVVALFVADDRWIRAASLPFTREIPRAGGTATVFTPQRAEHVHRAAIARAQSLVEQLASKANRRVDFRVLAEGEPQRVCEFIDEHTEVVIAPSMITRQPVYAQLSQLKCRIELIDDEQHESRVE